MYTNVEQKGDVVFSKRGAFSYQKILNDAPIKVLDGKIKYKTIRKYKGYTIKYNLNGVYGFSVWKNNTCLEDGFWKIKEVKECIDDMTKGV
jgi:hypothetical protein